MRKIDLMKKLRQIPTELSQEERKFSANSLLLAFINDINVSEVYIAITADKNDKISINWHIEDVQCQCPLLTDEEAFEVLKMIKREHDCTIGVNWDVIDYRIEDLYPEKWKRYEEIEDIEESDDK